MRLAPRGSVAAVLASLVIGGVAASGCGGGSGSDVPTLPEEDTGGTTIEAGGDSVVADAPGFDLGADDTTVVDSGGAPDTTSPDTAIADTAIADTAIADTGVADTGAADTGVLSDSAVGDGAGGDGVSTGDAKSDVVDAKVDTGPTGCALDSDGDGIPDEVEGRFDPAGPVDTDKDGTPDYLDTDSDGDGIPDKVEWAGGGCDPTGLNDADGDGIPNFQDLDSDGNGLPDKDEACPPVGMPGFPTGCSLDKPADFDGDGVMDFLDNDNDHDSASPALEVGLDDKFELTDATGKYVGLVDTDGDGIPDIWDRDSDNDTIFDLNDGLNDLDKDGIQNFRDTDSDGDGVPDKCEARNNPAETDFKKPLLDTDGDGKPDYLDTDSDGDLIADKDEDKNGDCIVGTGETSRVKKDTDGDGVDDLIETTLSPVGASWATDATKTPTNQGKFFFVVPWSADGSALPTPTASTLALSTNLNKGDVAFMVDTTFSMGEEIAALKASLSTTIIPALKAKIPDLGIGVAAHDDFPYSGYGVTGNLPFYISASPSGFVTTTAATSQTAANALTAHVTTADLPEPQVQAMYKAITGAALSWPAAAGPPATVAGSVAASSPPAGRFGGMHFRTDALPILIPITDAAFHNGKRARNKAPTGVAADYDATYQLPYPFTTFNVDDLVTKLNEVGAKVIGIGSDDGIKSVDGVYGYLAYLADKTNSVVPKSAFFPPTSCRTGLTGPDAADGPVISGAQGCRLVFSISTDGTGGDRLASSITEGVVALLNAVKFDVHVQAYKDPAETIDPVDEFMEKVEPLPAGGTDPTSPGGTATCVSFAASALADRYRTPKALAGPGDISETITGVNQGKLYCFSVVPKPNTTIAPKPGPQLFKAWLRVLAEKAGGGTFTLGTDREVLFIVPPIVN